LRLQIGQRVADEAAPHLFHRDTLRLAGRLDAGRLALGGLLQPRDGATAQLLGTQGRDIDEEKPALGGRRRLLGLGVRSLFGNDALVCHWCFGYSLPGTGQA